MFFLIVYQRNIIYNFNNFNTLTTLHYNIKPLIIYYVVIVLLTYFYFIILILTNRYRNSNVIT